VKVKPGYYREQAQRSRNLAKQAVLSDIRRHLLKVAEEYDNLAEEAEKEM
jgi:hypothetical protein